MSVIDKPYHSELFGFCLNFYNLINDGEESDLVINSFKDTWIYESTKMNLGYKIERKPKYINFIFIFGTDEEIYEAEPLTFFNSRPKLNDFFPRVFAGSLERHIRKYF